MSTRAMILVQYGEAWSSPYHMYYRHYDGYPTGLGNELVRVMNQGKNIDDILKKSEQKTNTRPSTNQKMHS